MAHQWFGDDVTLAWWDDTWLNESFASWMETKIVERWKPEWDLDVGAVGGKSRVMGADSLDSARTIRQPIESANDIANAFDGNYFPDVAAGGEPVVQWARWHPDERFLWTFFAESGMSEAGNLVEDVKAHLQQIIQQQPPVRQQLQREKGKGATFPDADWTSAEWPSDNEAKD